MSENPLVVGVSKSDPRVWTGSVPVSQLLDELSDYIPVERVCVQEVSPDGEIKLKQIGYVALSFLPMSTSHTKETATPKNPENLSESLSGPPKRKRRFWLF